MIIREDLPLARTFYFVANRVFLFFAVDIAITIGYVVYRQEWLSIPQLPLGLAGAALTVFLAFRIKAAYDRWWEARTLWGGLVNWSRTLARRCQVFLNPASGGEDEAAMDDFQQRMTYLQIAYVHALRSHLRQHDCFSELPRWLNEDEMEALRQHENVPMGIQLLMGGLAKGAFRRGWLDAFRLISIEDALAEITNVQGACERIKNTPFPRQFDHFPKMFTNVFCLFIPIGLVASLGLLTPIASSLIGFMLLSLESFGRQLESPFENTINDIPMSALSRMIEINLKQGLGERRLPEALKPIEGFLF
ncbi:MAG TPA: bestrophin family ion channel [Bryobacteraceae bacterium]|nr:bestrophin family ion channel [Bryobacteraceae bacterium]